jgi:preprotein translocase subunit SecA
MTCARWCSVGHNFAIVDEVDSILVDEARTPLIISGPTEDRSDLYLIVDDIVQASWPRTKPPTIWTKSSVRSLLTEDRLGKGRADHGRAAAGHRGRGFGRSVRPGQHLPRPPRQPGAARQHLLYTEATRTTSSSAGEVVLIDEFTGRMMQGRRLSEGLHQAIEAKEGVKIMPENQTLASVTIQNYFRLYEKLSGMTGTAATEAQEFLDIYKMDVLEVPTNRPVKRIDHDDEDLPHHRREEPGHRGPDRRMPRQGSADPGRHGVDREVGNPVRTAQDLSGTKSR